MSRRGSDGGAKEGEQKRIFKGEQSRRAPSERSRSALREAPRERLKETALNVQKSVSRTVYSNTQRFASEEKVAGGIRFRYVLASNFRLECADQFVLSRLFISPSSLARKVHFSVITFICTSLFEAAKEWGTRTGAHQAVWIALGNAILIVCSRQRVK